MDYQPPPQEVLNSPITELCKHCREAQWCIPEKQCLLARLAKSEEWHAVAQNRAAMANTLIRQDHKARERRFNDDPLTGFDE